MKNIHIFVSHQVNMASKKNKVEGKKLPSLAETVITSPEFNHLFYGYFENLDAKSSSRMLNDAFGGLNVKRESFKIRNITSRQINSWDQYGLLDFERNGSEWRTYTAMESVWLNIIFELRKFGCTIELIKKVKKSLTKESEKLKVAMPMLEFCVYAALPKNTPFVLVVFNDGSAKPISYEDYRMNINEYGLDSHICLNINDILISLYPGINIKPVRRA